MHKITVNGSIAWTMEDPHHYRPGGRHAFERLLNSNPNAVIVWTYNDEVTRSFNPSMFILDNAIIK